MKIFRKTRKREPLVEITLSGESTPEDPNNFYVCFCESLEAFCKPKNNKRVEFIFSFKLDYYNSSSTFHITRILMILKPLVRRKLVKINWYYYKTDEDMKEMGADLIETMHVPMKLSILPYLFLFFYFG